MNDSAENRPAARPRRSPAFLATAVALPVAVLVCFVVFVVLAQRQASAARDAAEAGQLKSVAAPSANDTQCTSLLAALPSPLGMFTRDESSEPAGFARWKSANAGSVEVRCGTERPGELTPTAKLQLVNSVQWIETAPPNAPIANGGSYWAAVDYRPYVTIWVPDGAGTAPLQALSDEISSIFERASLDMG